MELLLKEQGEGVLFSREKILQQLVKMNKVNMFIMLSCYHVYIDVPIPAQGLSLLL